MAQQAEGLLGALLSDYQTHLRRTNYARLTQQTYLCTVRRFLDFFRADLSSVTPAHIDQYLDTRPLSPRSRAVELERFRSFFAWAVQTRRIKANPCDEVVRPRWKARLRPSVTWDQFGALCRVCKTQEELAFVRVFYYTGLRISELLGVRGRDVDRDARRIRTVGKGGHERIVVFPPEILGLIPAVGPDERLFPHGAKRVNAFLARLGRSASLPYHLTSHIVRHGFFRLLKTRGVPLEVAAKLGGHRSITTTAHIYGQLDEGDLQEIYDKKITVSL